MPERNRLRLGDLIAVKHGFAFLGVHFSDDPSLPTLVTPGNFAIGGGFQSAKPKTYAGRVPEEFILKPGALMITMTDLSRDGVTLGLPALIPADDIYLHNQRIGLVEVQAPDRVDLRFLSYYLRTTAYREHVLGTATGSTVRHTSPGRIESFELDLPVIKEQRAIAEVLGALDDKIAVNTKIASTAHELAAAMFRQMQVHATTEATLGSLITLEYGKALPAALRVPGSIEVFGSGGVVGRHDEALVRGPGVVVGRKGTVGSVYWAARDFYPIDTTFYVMPKTRATPLIFCYFALSSLRLDDQNSDSAVPGLNRNEAYASKLRLPTPEEITDFGANVLSLFELAFQVDRESASLGTLQDSLLPQLMSGKLRVKDAKKTAEEVL